MEKIFSLDSYKQYLIGYYKNNGDIGKDAERKQYIESKYSDNYLEKVVINTEMFLLNVIKEMLNHINNGRDRACYKQEISTWVYQRITNGCNGGWSADRLICPDETHLDVLVSTYLLKSFFGQQFIFEISEDLEESYDEEDEVGSIHCTTQLNIQGSKSALLEILERKVPKQYCLIKK